MFAGAGRLVGERVAEPISPETALRVHEARELVRTEAADRASMERALRLNPNDPDATLALARIALSEGDKAEATRLAQALLATPPERASQARAAQDVLEAAR